MRDFKDCNRIVVKIGTNTLSKNHKIDTQYLNTLADQVKQLVNLGKQLVIITSGAIGMGAGLLQYPSKVKSITKRQAFASIGQPLLMYEYYRAFSNFGLTISQVLITTEVLNNRQSYVNLKNAMEELVKLGVIPIFNENDCVSTEEIGTAFGDNDKLSALVASKIDADLLIMLSDIDALYTGDPKKDAKAEPIRLVTEITEKIESIAGGSGSLHSTGGMKTKIAAAKIVHNTGCKLVMANGRDENILLRIIAGEEIGTLFLPKDKISNRLRWIINSKPNGQIHIDQGAEEALRKNKSLLPSGIKSINGHFDDGAVVWLNNVAKAVTSLGSQDIQKIIGIHSSKIKEILGPDKPDVVAIPENIVFIDE